MCTPQEVMEQTGPPAAPQTAADVPPIAGTRGGPLFMPGFISPLISVRNFQGSCVTLLMALQAELNDASIQCSDDTDLLVDDLKIVSEEQLVNHALKKVVEEKISGAMECDSETSKPKVSCSSPMLASDAHISNGSTWKQRKKAKQKIQRRGRPFDRAVRAAAWGEGEEALSEEPMYSRLKRERETARSSCALRSLSLKDRQRSAVVRLDSQKKLRALDFFVAPMKVDTMAVVSAVEDVPAFEVILWIEIAKRSKKQKAQNFLVLGSQILTTLRDKIYCLSDKLMRKANSYVPSGYFQIENVYYNDLRDPAATDYSFPILKWMYDQVLSGLRSSVAHSADMATTQFLDLQCRVGKRYVYCHQGDCKHTLMVRDMRLIHKEDIQNTLLYPVLRSPFRVRQRKCTICAIYVATKVTFDDKMAPQSPCFFCDYCYYVQHYSQDGTLVYSDFKVYDYYHE